MHDFLSIVPSDGTTLLASKQEEAYGSKQPGNLSNAPLSRMKGPSGNPQDFVFRRGAAPG